MQRNQGIDTQENQGQPGSKFEKFTFSSFSAFTIAPLSELEEISSGGWDTSGNTVGCLDHTFVSFANMLFFQSRLVPQTFLKRYS
jgi:hypothetical protein